MGCRGGVGLAVAGRRGSGWHGPAARAPLLGAIYVGVSAAVNLVVLMRFVLVALMASCLFSFLFSLFPITPQPSAWYAPSGYVALAVVLAVLLYGFRIALAGRPLFGAALLED